MKMKTKHAKFYRLQLTQYLEENLQLSMTMLEEQESEWSERAEWLCDCVLETGSACSMADQLTEEQIAEF